LLNPLFLVELADENSFLCRADPVLLIPRGAVETLSAVQAEAVQFIMVDPLLLIPCGHVRNALAV
jgi:hypothetical protein